MAKLITLAVALTLLFAVAAASTITMVDQENPGQSSRCQQQPEALPACQRYLRESSRPVTEERERNDWREEFPECCKELEQVEKECRCDGVKRTVEAERQQGKLQGMEMREMQETARSLPALCRVTSPSRCDIEREVA